jgi:hypothetical protein
MYLVNKIQQDHCTNPTLVHPWEWLLPTPIVPEGLSSDYDLTPILSCSQEAFAPFDNAYDLVDDNLANWLQRESLSDLATDTIEDARGTKTQHLYAVSPTNLQYS